MLCHVLCAPPSSSEATTLCCAQRTPSPSLHFISLQTQAPQCASHRSYKLCVPAQHPPAARSPLFFIFACGSKAKGLRLSPSQHTNPTLCKCFVRASPILTKLWGMRTQAARRRQEQKDSYKPPLEGYPNLF